ncbi:lipoyl synthase [Marine Group I thaumarchaeote]|uniref:Lipoyl synthase n=1 Tax=Marine Group I thaumarchaeote TaxID=2511932 RepID=A0A7K4P1I2_9ARCH|nr:MAG: lipoyl synthase [Nitrosopumilus sp. YT1]NMI82094.1 lipoyl synthase [Candidatus Nitrosopumilus sp. MTA1]NWJ20308.1 lipoyl synthase [Marine Group I thaumarchaeote]NWJ29192.1 lipoyl synthase [Marine Group I thaumarchaeote]NWJ57648.1 lipoyl synthase [Marine Group I thaumarchaeote]
MSLIRPSWLKMKIPSGENYVKVRKTLQKYNLHTVCEEASCPNVSECWGVGTATIMIMGDVCSRGCKFCNVETGKPFELDSEEPQHVAEAIKEWSLRYVVITSVCRDDLPDEGSEHFARTIQCIKSECPNTVVESLIPDFSGNEKFIETIVKAKPNVIGHNVETVKRLSSSIRDLRANYKQSLKVLKYVKELDSNIFTKSSLMLGLGESEEEILQTAQELRDVDVDIITLGQYLQPTLSHLSVKEFVTPEKFYQLKLDLKKLGFLHVESGPLVRSSFRASDVIDLIIKNTDNE